jgi:hypothetical protein
MKQKKISTLNPLLIAGILVFLGAISILSIKMAKPSTAPFVLPTSSLNPSPTPSPTPLPKVKISKVPGTSKWMLYQNLTDDFSFEYPSDYRLDPNYNPMSMYPTNQPPGGGGWIGGIFVVEVIPNKEKIALDEYVTQFDKKYVDMGFPPGNYEKLSTKMNITGARVDRKSPGASWSQFMILQDKSQRIFHINFPEGKNEVVQHVVDTFQSPMAK